MIDRPQRRQSRPIQGSPNAMHQAGSPAAPSPAAPATEPMDDEAFIERLARLQAQPPDQRQALLVKSLKRQLIHVAETHARTERSAKRLHTASEARASEPAVHQHADIASAIDHAVHERHATRSEIENQTDQQPSANDGQDEAATDPALSSSPVAAAQQPPRAHYESEKRYRASINEKFQALHQSLPVTGADSNTQGTRGTRARQDKITVLTDAVDYIKQLEQRLARREREVDRLKAGIQASVGLLAETQADLELDWEV